MLKETTATAAWTVKRKTFQLNDWQFTLTTVVPFPAKEVFSLGFYVYLPSEPDSVSQPI